MVHGNIEEINTRRVTDWACSRRAQKLIRAQIVLVGLYQAVSRGDVLRYIDRDPSCLQSGRSLRWVRYPQSTGTLFLANFYPLPPVTLCHTSQTPRFLVGLVQKSRTKVLQILSQLFEGVFVRGVLSGGLLSGRFCPRWFLSIPPFVRIHLLQQKVKHHFKFNVSYVW